MLFSVYIDTDEFSGGLSPDQVEAVADVAEQIKRISDPIVAGGGQPAVLSIQMNVEAGDDHVKAAKIGVQAFKDALRNAGIPAFRIRRVVIGMGPDSGEDAPGLAAVANR